jgi:pyruvate/2-oxoglutarate dehydrogenase complex dihydrolipoamide acyltransferase (E2) component
VHTDGRSPRFRADKAAVGLPADPAACGTRKVGETVTVGDVIARIEEDGAG